MATPIHRIKETADRGPQELEQKKQEQLKKQKEGKGEWHEELVRRTRHDLDLYDRCATGL